MCVPMDTSEDAARLGRGGLDAFSRLRLVADAYGLPPDRKPFLDTIEGTIARGGMFVQARIDAGEQAFIEMSQTTGGRRPEPASPRLARGEPRSFPRGPRLNPCARGSRSGPSR
jgi:hypothetical protein